MKKGEKGGTKVSEADAKAGGEFFAARKPKKFNFLVRPLLAKYRYSSCRASSRSVVEDDSNRRKGENVRNSSVARQERVIES